MPLKEDTGVVEAQEEEAKEEAAKLCKLFCYLNSLCHSDWLILFTVKEVTEKVEKIKVEVYFYLQLSYWMALITWND